MPVVKLQLVAPSDSAVFDFDEQETAVEYKMKAWIYVDGNWVAMPSGRKLYIGLYRAGEFGDAIWFETTTDGTSIEYRFTGVKVPVPGEWKVIGKYIHTDDVVYYTSGNDEAVDKTTSDSPITIVFESNSALFVEEPVVESDHLISMQDRSLFIEAVKALSGGRNVNKAADWFFYDVVVAPDKSSGKLTIKFDKNKYGEDTLKGFIADTVMIYTGYYENLTMADKYSIYRVEGEGESATKVYVVKDMPLKSVMPPKVPLVFAADVEYTIEINLVQKVVGSEEARFGFRFRGVDVVKK